MKKKAKDLPEWMIKMAVTAVALSVGCEILENIDPKTYRQQQLKALIFAISCTIIIMTILLLLIFKVLR